MTYAGLMYESWQQLQPKCKKEITFSKVGTHLFLFFFQVEHSIQLRKQLFLFFEHSMDTSLSFFLFNLFLSIKKEVSYLYSIISIFPYDKEVATAGL